MDDNTGKREQFEELAERLASVSDDEVLEVLVDAREAGLVSKALDEQINRLRDGMATPAEIIEWAGDVAGGGDEFSFQSMAELSQPSSIEIDEEEAAEDIDFEMVGDGDAGESSAESRAVSGESQTSDEGDSESEEPESLESEQSEPELLPEIEEGQILEESEASSDGGLFDDLDDLGDLMAEAGQKAIEDSPAFKLPKLKATKKLSGDAKKKLSKRFSLPNPTKQVKAVPRPGGESTDQAAQSDTSGNETPIAGLEAIQGLVANSSQRGTTPDAEESESEDDFGFGELELSEIVQQATAESEGAGDSEPSEAEISLEEPVSEEVLLLDDPASQELILDSIAEESSVAGSDSDAAPDEPDAEDSEEGFDLDFGDLDDPPGGGEASESEPGESSGGGFGGGPAMGSLFDDDELAEIQAAGEEEPKTTAGSSPGVRYDSGNSGARYAGKAPPPPTHRLRSGNSGGGEPKMTGFQVESEGDEDDFDLGLGFSSDSGASFGTPTSTSHTPIDSDQAEESDDDEFDFDLGLSNPEQKSGDSTPGVPIGQESSVQEDDDDFDFDLGFANPADKIEAPGTGPKGYSEGDFDLGLDDIAPEDELGDGDSRGVTRGPPGADQPGSSTEENEDYDVLRKQAVRSDVLGGTPVRDHQPTPMRQESVQRPSRPSQPTPIARDRVGGASEVSDDEFEDLASQLEGNAVGQYRGEPMLSDESSIEELVEVGQGHADEDNPFAHEAPTGVRHAAVESSFVLEEVSAAEDSTNTNLAAILLEARRLYENGEFASAMEIVQKVLSREESQEALDLQQAIEGELERHELEKLGSLSKIPELQISMAEIPSLDIDHRAGFLLSQIDGMMSFEDLLELSAMSRFETLTVLSDLVEKGVIAAD